MEILGWTSYKRIKEIGAGQGLNSKVFLVDDLQLGGTMAAKEIEKSDFPDEKAYFVETQTMFATAHENVVEVRYACQTPKLISLIMPYYQKGSLATRIADRPLQLSEVQRVAQGVLSGLARIHLSGFIHFDIKPSNVLFSDRNVPMVADFGQSRAISATGVVTVPPLYNLAMPPETIASTVATPVADIYHVGLLMYRCLNGNKFYEEQTPDSHLLLSKIEKGKFPDRNKFMPHVPQRLRTLVRKALRIDPADRFHTATEMADALGRVGIPFNWSVESVPPDGFRWVASRIGYCDLVVELLKQGSSWDVRTFTETATQAPRARDRSANWRSGLSRDEAYAHLRDVFERLEQ